MPRCTNVRVWSSQYLSKAAFQSPESVVDGHRAWEYLGLPLRRLAMQGGEETGEVPIRRASSINLGSRPVTLHLLESPRDEEIVRAALHVHHIA